MKSIIAIFLTFTIVTCLHGQDTVITSPFYFKHKDMHPYTINLMKTIGATGVDSVTLGKQGETWLFIGGKRYLWKFDKSKIKKSTPQQH